VFILTVNATEIGDIFITGFPAEPTFVELRDFFVDKGNASWIFVEDSFYKNLLNGTAKDSSNEYYLFECPMAVNYFEEL